MDTVEKGMQTQNNNMEGKQKGEQANNNEVEKGFWYMFFSLPPIVSLVFIFAGPALLFLNPFAIVMLSLLLPFIILGMKNKIVRDIILLIPLFVYYGTWAFVFYGVALAGHFFGGKLKKYFDLGIYSIIFSIVALYTAFEGHPIKKVIFRYDWRYADNEWEHIMFFSTVIYFVVYMLVTIAIGNMVNSGGNVNVKSKGKSVNKPITQKDSEKIDPNKASFKEKNAIRMEKWVRKDRSDS